MKAQHLFLAALAVVVALLAALFWPKPDPVDLSRPLVLYCAAGMTLPVEEAIEEYRKEFPVEIRTDFAGSGALLSRIRAKPEGDLYLAADASYIALARDHGIVKEAIPLARMRPVIAVKKGNPKGIRGVADLLREDVVVAIANPEAASVGKHTKRILTASGDWERLAARIKVTKPTVNDVANDIKIGTVDAGVIWDATANQYPEVEAVRVPMFDRETLDVTIGIFVSSPNSASALRFARYLQAPEKGAPIFTKHGFETIEGDPWTPTPELVFYSGGVNRLAIEQTIEEFKAREGVEIKTKYNGCGILSADMKAVAGTDNFPDGYFSCDVSFMAQVENLFEPSENIAETDMVILAPKGNPRGLNSLAALAGPDLKLGLAHPEQSALGALTVRLLREAGLYERIHPNVRMETPTADLLVDQMLVGALDGAIVYRANTSRVTEKLAIVDIDHPEAKAIQPIAVSRSSRYKFLMGRLLDAIRSIDSRDRFSRTGFRWRLGESAPGEDVVE